MSRLNRLYETIRVVCPCDGVSVVDWADRSTWRVTGNESATAEQRAAAQSVIDSFNTSDAAQAAWEAQQRRQEVLRLLMSNEPTMIGIRALGMLAMSGIGEAKDGLGPATKKTWPECLAAFRQIIIDGLAEVQG